MKKEELFERWEIWILYGGKTREISAFTKGCMVKKWTAAAACAVIIGGAVLGLRHGEMDRGVRQSVTRRG